MANFTSDVLVASIKRRGSIPTSQNLIKQADFYALINEELQSNLVPYLMSVREEYFVADFDYSIQLNKTTYRIPQRAIGGKLRDVLYVRVGGSAYPLPRLDEAEVASNNNSLNGFYLFGNSVVLNPIPTNTSDTLRLRHFRRPNTVVDVSACGQVTAINTVTNQVTCSSVPTSFTTNVLCDFVKAQSGFECLQIDSPIVNISGSTITFSSLPTDLAIGDWISLAGESPIPQIPQELHPLLAQLVTVKCLEALGDAGGLSVAQSKLKELQESLMHVIAPRVDGEMKKIKSSTSLISGLRRGRMRSGWNA
jgi:hypothetical protein